MNYLKARVSAAVLMILAASLWVCFAPEARAQGQQAIVIIKPAGGLANDCDGTAEINYHIVFDLKLNSRDKIRLLTNETIKDGSARISRQVYESARPQDLRSFLAIECGRDGVWGVVSGSGQAPTPLLPDNKRPERNEAPAIRDFYSVMATGEAREGRQRRPLSLMLRDIWKVYFVPDGAAANDSLFSHAAEEKSIALWEAYLKKTNNHRASEANGLMREALIGCANDELARFLKGDYRAIERARQKAERAHGVREDEASTQLLANLRKEKQNVDGTRSQAEALIRASDWDKALRAIEPIKIYLESWPELKQMFEHALRQSHESHLFEGEKSLKANQFENALNYCSTAWERLPDSSKARDCVCESRKQIALGKAQTARQQRRPKESKEILERQLDDRDCGADARLTAELGKARCEYAQQLFAAASQLIAPGSAPPPVQTTPATPRGQGKPGAPRPAANPSGNSAPATPHSLKPVAPQNKNDFREARAKLIEAEQLCADEPKRALLEAANHSLSAYCLAEARKAMQRGAAATAYVYLQTAQVYTPGETAALETLNQARAQLEAQTRVGVGVALVNRSGNGQAEMLINELAAELESAARDAGLANPIVMDRRQAAATLQAIQTGRPLPTPAVVFFGDLLAANLRRSDYPRRVSSTYWYDNPRYEQADRSYAEQKAVYEQCKRNNGGNKIPCGSLEAEVNRRDAIRRSIEKRLKQPYEYGENTIKVDGQIKLSFRSTDSIARSLGAAETLADSVNKQCVERGGAHEQDTNYAQNAACQIVDEQTHLMEMLTKIKREARSRALTHLRQLPLSYYSRAQSAANRQQAMEDYLRFLFLTEIKNSREAEEARKALVAFDPELQTDGVLR